MSENSALPALSDERIEAMERAVFERIGAEPHPPRASARRRRRGWLTGLAAAAVVVACALVAPPLLNGLGSSGSDAGGEAGVSTVAPASGGTRDGGAVFDRDLEASGGAVAPRDERGMKGADAPITRVDDTREIITTAEMVLRVQDAEDAADDIAALAADRGGFVQSASLGLNPQAGDATPELPRKAGTGWISIRIPSADLDPVMADLADHGEVLHSSIARDDVTTTAVDLRARIDSARASVKRLTELMKESGSVADLIAAETALSERQAQLESWEQQLTQLEEQVSLATISIQLTEQPAAAGADPAGFGDGLLAGWNGLVTSINALVVAIGFLLPWFGIAAVALLVIWLLRRRRARATAASEPTP